MYEEEEGISLKELLLVLIKGKKIIAWVTVVLLLCALVGSMLVPHIHLGSVGQVQTAVRLYFQGIDEGLLPDGTKYDPNTIKSAEIVQTAMDRMALKKKPGTADVASCISFQAVLPEDVAKTLANISELKTEQLKLERLENLAINPDTYILTFDVARKLGLSQEEGRELLDNIILCYREQLIEEYADYEVLPNGFVGDFPLEQYDYIQAADLLNEQLFTMEQYVQSNMSDETFISASTGLSKQDMLNALAAIQKVNIEVLYTKIAVSYATKDAKKSVAIYETLAEDKEQMYQQSNEEAYSLYQLITTFRGPEHTLLLGNDMENPYVLKDQSEQYDRMVSRYIAAGSRATAAQADGNYYRAEADRFRGTDGFAGPGSAAAEEIEQLIRIGKTRIEKETKLINETVQDYYHDDSYEKYGEQIIPSQSYDQESDINLPLNMAIALVAGLLLGILIVLFREYLRTEEQGVMDHETHVSETNK